MCYVHRQSVLLRRGVVSELTGVLSMMMMRNTENASSTVIPREIFSPEPGGSQKTPSAIIVTSTMGRMML